MFASQLYKLCFSPSTEKEMIDYIYTSLDEMLLAKRFNEVDGILSELKLTLLTVSAMISILTITAPFDQELRTRIDFYEDVKKDLIRRCGLPETEKLLKGL